MIADLLQRGYDRNRRVIQAQAAGLTHAESLTQTEYNVNCFNWVLGHVVDGRSSILKTLGFEPSVPDGLLDAYLRESEPIVADGPGVVPFEELLRLLDLSQEGIGTMLAAATEEWLAEAIQVTPERTSTRLSQLMFAYFHDTYHTGQTELLRQMSGYSDKII